MKKITSLVIVLVLTTLWLACDDGSSGIKFPIGGVTPSVTGDSGGSSSGFTWLGSFATAPSSPSANQAYFNTSDGNCYLYTGSAWSTMIQSRNAKVLDANSNFLGFALGTDSVFTPKGYILGIMLSTAGQLTIDYNHGTSLLFASTDCTGTPYAYIEGSYNVAGVGGLMHNGANDNFYKRKSTTKTNIRLRSRNNGMTAACLSTDITVDAYEYETITRTDAGLPNTITAPFTFLFQ